MDMGLDGRRALVVGAGGGIGRAVALALAAEGARVVAADLRLDTAQGTADLIAERGITASAAAVDATDKADCDALVADTVARLGGLDLLVNTVGWTDTTLFVDETPEYWHKVVAINLFSSFNLSHAALGHMIPAGGGTIVLTTSDAGKVGTKGETAYASAKAGVIGFVKSLAREVSRYDIRINAVAPGPTDTPLLHEHSSSDIIERMVRAVPMRRVSTPEEQADAILFLASSRASYITGQTLSVSGGLTMSS